jgi:hypothetical protein
MIEVKLSAVQTVDNVHIRLAQEVEMHEQDAPFSRLRGHRAMP